MPRWPRGEEGSELVLLDGSAVHMEVPRQSQAVCCVSLGVQCSEVGGGFAGWAWSSHAERGQRQSRPAVHYLTSQIFLQQYLFMIATPPPPLKKKKHVVCVGRMPIGK